MSNVTDKIAARPEVIRPSKFNDGQDRMGTPAAAEHRDAKTQRYKDGAALRAKTRDTRNDK